MNAVEVIECDPKEFLFSREDYETADRISEALKDADWEFEKSYFSTGGRREEHFTQYVDCIKRYLRFYRAHGKVHAYAQGEREYDLTDRFGCTEQVWVEFDIDEQWSQDYFESLEDFARRVSESVLDYEGPDFFEP